jgi:hypothetical protein
VATPAVDAVDGLGKTRPEGTMQGIAIRGAQPITAFRQAIDRLLGEKEP